MKTAVCVLAKNESKYIDEWLDYHTKLGIDWFFVFNNDLPENNSLEILMPELVKKYPVHFFNLRGPDILAKFGMQRGVFNFAYSNFIRPNRFDWVAFIDIDEFLYLDNKSVKEFLSQDFFADTDVIHLNWRVYGDNDKIFYENEPVMKRFINEAPLDAKYNGDEIAKGISENMFVKSFLRVSNKKIIIDTHTSYLEAGICRRGNGILTNYMRSAEPLSSDNNFVKHYITKSLEEYIDKRCINPTDVAHYVTPPEKRIEWYFNLNKKTPEKIKYVKDRLGMNI